MALRDRSVFYAIEEPDVAELLMVKVEMLDAIAAAVDEHEGAVNVSPELLAELLDTSTPLDRFTVDELIGIGQAVGVRVHVYS